ncbi:hypothetical protein BDN71DRAFT_1432935 [Pleurotus eryngii]|uniref:Uncharacterized protein n=1 Tax=Pleurotus eryngii TaxID=5323 RepID=A0A9P6DDF4_PLEER|nr:hypothetical protein BDN71DRAFT_1432934 [Pleurotus eryngii]KAF9492790.1 hypothetical protein BDN71DRAFT_1432935 [Pleurotus eryngii]
MKTTNELSKAQVKREWAGLQQVNECGRILLQWPVFVVAKVAQCEVTGVGGRKWEWQVGMASKKMHDRMEREEWPFTTAVSMYIITASLSWDLIISPQAAGLMGIY